ncbi:hypothetical protein K2W90_05760 [Candidatus Babeliales bacterium]|nr:hypothetical protein [Candidatus Babeliales bacterium]
MKILWIVCVLVFYAQCSGAVVDYQLLKKQVDQCGSVVGLLKSNAYYTYLDVDRMTHGLSSLDKIVFFVEIADTLLPSEQKASLCNACCAAIFSIFSYLTNSDKLIVQNFVEAKKVFERALRIFATAHVNLLENQKILPVESPKRKRSNSDMGWAAPDVMATMQKVITDLLAGHTFEVKIFFDEVVALVQKKYEGEDDEEDYKIDGSVGLWLDSD